MQDRQTSYVCDTKMSVLIKYLNSITYRGDIRRLWHVFECFMTWDHMFFSQDRMFWHIWSDICYYTSYINHIVWMLCVITFYVWDT